MNSPARHLISVQSSQSNLARDVIKAISPVPKGEKSRTRKRRIESAEVLTGSPYKKMLLDKKCKAAKHEKNPKYKLLTARNQTTWYQKGKRNLPVERTSGEDVQNSRGLVRFTRRNLQRTSIHPHHSWKGNKIRKCQVTIKVPWLWNC